MTFDQHIGMTRGDNFSEAMIELAREHPGAPERAAAGGDPDAGGDHAGVAVAEDRETEPFERGGPASSARAGDGYLRPREDGDRRGDPGCPRGDPGEQGPGGSNSGDPEDQPVPSTAKVRNR